MLVGKPHTTTELLAWAAPASAPTRTVVSGRQRFRGRSDDTVRFTERISENSQTIDGQPYVADGNGAFRRIDYRPRHSVDRVTASTPSQRRPPHDFDRATASTPSQRRPPHDYDRVSAWPSRRRRRSASSPAPPSRSDRTAPYPRPQVMGCTAGAQAGLGERIPPATSLIQ